MSGVRDRMIAGAARLLAQRGLQATSLSTVLAEANAPRGSIYHHFPGGKEELVSGRGRRGVTPEIRLPSLRRVPGCGQGSEERDAQGWASWL